MKPGRAGTLTHDYKRNGTTDLFAALNVATGEVLYDCRKNHTGKDVLAPATSARCSSGSRPHDVVTCPILPCDRVLVDAVSLHPVSAHPAHPAVR